MATYYVANQHPSASDSNTGTSASAPWLTPTKAMATVTSGDTVWFGGGTYIGNFTLSTSGTLASPIKWRADVTGVQTGYPGIVIWTAQNDRVVLGGSGSTLALNGKEFNEFYNIVFGGGGSGASDYTLKATTGNTTYQGILFDTCSFLPPLTAFNPTITLNYNTGGTLTGTPPTFRDCYIGGAINTTYGSFTANVACGIQLINCVIDQIASQTPIFLVNIDGPDSSPGFGPKGYLIQNNVFKGSEGSAFRGLFAAGDQWASGTIGEIYNNIFVSNYSDSIMGFWTDSGSWVGDGNKFTATNYGLGSGAANYTKGRGDLLNCTILFGHQVDNIYQKAIGYNPYKAWEQTEHSAGVSTGTPLHAYTADMHGNPRSMGRAGRIGIVCWMDASDNAISDPNNVFTTEANMVDGSLSTIGYTSTIGSESSNYAYAGGTNALDYGVAIKNVYARIYGNRTGSAVGKVRIYTDGLAETLGTITYTNSSPAYSSWLLLTPPAAGWTWAAVQALEFKAWTEASASNTGIYICEIGVEYVGIDAGAVETNSRPTKNTSDVFGDGNSAEFSGAGYKDFFQPVTAGAHTITFKARYDGNYTGTKPTLEVRNIVGDTNKSDTMTEAANTTETLSCVFTATADCWVWVRISSLDTSTNGKCYFDTGVYA